jgi:hydroxyacylglutathione hydrolase
MIKITAFEGGYNNNFCYLVVSGEDAIIIDPFIENEVDRALKELTLQFIINTHTHFDHVEGNKYYKEKYDAQIVCHRLGEIEADIKVDEKDTLKLGKTDIQFIHTPGHTAESMCILIEDSLFTGDTLFVGGVGNTQSGKDENEMMNSIKKIMKLPDKTKIYPGHNYGSEKSSTVGREKKENQYIKI